MHFAILPLLFSRSHLGMNFFRCTDPTVPDIGSKFTGNMYFPLIGTQKIHLSVKSKKIANIELSGVINVADDIEYYVKKGEFGFILSENLENILKKYHCSINEASYIDNVATVKIHIKPLRIKRSVVLNRIYS